MKVELILLTSYLASVSDASFAQYLTAALEETEVTESDYPSLVPSDMPSMVPSGVPSDIPSDVPSLIPEETAAEEEDANIWRPLGIFGPDTPSFGFGEEMDMSADGLTLSVVNGDSLSVFNRPSLDSNTWTLMGDAIPMQGFLSIQLSPNGQVMMVHTTRSIDILSWDGVAWEQQGASVPKPFTGDTFASMSGDGMTVALGYPGQFFDPYRVAGYVKIFKFENNEWFETIRIDGQSNERNIGRSVTLSQNGEILAFAGRGTGPGDSIFVQLYNLESQLMIGRRFVDPAAFGHAGAKLSDDGNTLYVQGPNQQLDVYQHESGSWLNRSSGLPGNYDPISMDISSDGKTLLFCNQNDRRAEVFELQQPFRQPSVWEKTVDFHQNFGVALVGRACTISGDGRALATAGWSSTDFSSGAIAIWQRTWN